ncbi:MAG: ABC transporter permease [Rhizobiaceae bacterium]|nr:ABC transporter permease [Rhizobiaceae bacterium]
MTSADKQVEAKNRSLWGDVWSQFRTHKGAMVGMVVFSIILFGVTAGPFLWKTDPQYLDIRAKNTFPMISCFFTGSQIAQCFSDPTSIKFFDPDAEVLERIKVTWAHPIGSDQLGRDLLAQLLQGGRVSLAVGMTAMLLSLVLGTVAGVVAGYFKRLDGPIMRLTDLFLALPLLPLLLVIIMLFRDTLRNAFGPETGIFLLIVFIIGITSWMQTARIVRGDVLALKEREFILAANSIGTPSKRIITRHILPNILSPIMVSATLGVATAIITESALSFLGLGFPSDFPTWGRLLFDGTTFIQQSPARVIWPGLAISLTVLSVNFIGDGLRDALDPRIRGR